MFVFFSFIFFYSPNGNNTQFQLLHSYKMTLFPFTCCSRRCGRAERGRNFWCMISPPLDGLKDTVIGNNTYMRCVDAVICDVYHSTVCCRCHCCRMLSLYLQPFTLLYFDMDCLYAKETNYTSNAKQQRYIHLENVTQPQRNILKCCFVRPVIEIENKRKV